MLPEWKARYSVNHTTLDAQHKELFRLAGRVYSLDMRAFTKERVRELLREFYSYMKIHFSEEEEYMATIEYPELDAHKQLHQEIIAGMNAILEQSPNYAHMRESMKKIVKDWLVDHILIHDLNYEQWRKKRYYIDLTHKK